MFPTSLRTHTCGDVSSKELNKKVSLCGWINTRRDHGGIIFIDLRDRYGLTQIVFDPEFNKEIHKSAEFLRREDCIQVIGAVKKRKKGFNARCRDGDMERDMERYQGRERERWRWRDIREEREIDRDR